MESKSVRSSTRKRNSKSPIKQLNFMQLRRASLAIQGIHHKSKTLKSKLRAIEDKDISNTDIPITYTEEDIKLYIRRVFKVSEKKYKIVNINPAATNVVINDGKQNCVDMTIYKNTHDIFINHIDKCKFFRGKQLVENILEFAKHLNISKISLQDKSMIHIGECNIMLPYYYILLNGVSWYNMFGFKSIQYREEQDINSTIPHMSLDEFKTKIVENYNKKATVFIRVEDDFDKIINDICLRQTKHSSEKIKRILYTSVNIGDFVKKLAKYADDAETCLFLQCLIFISKMYLIRYNPNLSFVA